MLDPSKGRARPPGEEGEPDHAADQTTPRSNSTASVTAGTLTGCSCGCRSRWMTPVLGYYLDPDCILARPLGPETVDYLDSPTGTSDGRLTDLRHWREVAAV